MYDEEVNIFKSSIKKQKRSEALKGIWTVKIVEKNSIKLFKEILYANMLCNI